MGSRKPFWKFSGHSHRSAPSRADKSPTAVPTVAEAMPVEFLCPISRTLMADPVIVPPAGHTFERACIQACADLALSPPGFALDLNPDALYLIPNVALRSTILGWCHRSGVPPPQPVPPEAAYALVRRLMSPSSSSGNPPRSSYVSGGRDLRGEFVGRFASLSVEEAAEEEKDAAFMSPPEVTGAASNSCGSRYDEEGEDFRGSSAYYDAKVDSFGGRSTRSNQDFWASANPNATSRQAPASPFRHDSSSATEFAVKESPKETQPQAPAPDPPASSTSDSITSEEDLLNKFGGMEPSEQESGLVLLRQATRESGEQRTALCKPRILAALRSMLLSSSAAVQINATAALVNLSLERENRALIFRSGVVPPLVEVLKRGNPEARGHAASLIFSLSLAEDNRAAIAVLGVIPPLLDLFCVPTADGAARRDAGMALYYLSLNIANQTKIARAPGAVRSLLAVAMEKDAEASAQGPGLARLALMMACNLAGCNEGRAALMDGGAVAAVVSLMRSPAAAAEEEYCVAALYGMSRGSLRFRGLARAVGAERVLMQIAESGDGDVRREMAKKVLRAMRGEEDNEYAASSSAVTFPMGGDSSVVSEGMMSIRRRPNHYNNAPRLNSAEF
ncbi:U-box domain-containing protein 41-like [Curcuma longa]|uniref:U-box domain-containing protein 41-like n=1 Tax=Curcuma longa TaxID=136217 RepID=UPI003D9E0602